MRRYSLVADKMALIRLSGEKGKKALERSDHSKQVFTFNEVYVQGGVSQGVYECNLHSEELTVSVG